MTEVTEQYLKTANWSSLVDAAVAFRHHLHRHPELGWQEALTAQSIRERLSAAGISWKACADTGTIATLAPQAEGAPVALRADIDALPIEEQTGRDYTSAYPGCMHACGHDGHTATLFAAFWWLKKHEQQLLSPVRLLFQPAEEGGHGARKMIEDGALEGVSRIYGWHNWPAIPYGQAVCPDGPVMAANGTFRIRVTGQGGHASQPERCRDPVLAASAITLALQQLVSRRLAPQDATVLSVTFINASGADTVIPDQAELGGSFRLANDNVRGELAQLIDQIARDTAASYGTEAEVAIFPRYGATINHTGPAADFRVALKAEFGESWQSQHPMPVMASEDFSYYLQVIPGAFALVGADDGHGHHEPCHSSRYDFNDSLIARMGRIFSRLAGAPLPDTTP